MDDIQRYIDEHGDSLGESAKELSLAATDFAVNLKKLLDKLRAKNATITRKPVKAESETSEKSFKIQRKESDTPDLDPNAKANESLTDIRKSLANEQTVEFTTEVNGTDYKVSKNRSNGIKIESSAGKLYNKVGRENLYDGNTNKLEQDLPQIENEIANRFAPQRKRSTQNSDRESSKTETLYGYDRSGKFVDNKLSAADARAVKSLMEGKEGQILEGDNAKNLLITFGNETLFETDANGTIIHNAYQRDPSLNASYEKKEAKGLNTLESYINRTANTPDPAVSVNRSRSNAAAGATDMTFSGNPLSPSSGILPLAPDSETAWEINYATVPNEIGTEHLVDTLGDKVLKDAFPNTDKKSVRTIDGVKFEKSKLENDRYNISIVNADKSKSINIGTLDRQGKFEANPKVANNPQVRAAAEKILAARGIEPGIETERANAMKSVQQAKNPPLTQENAPKQNLAVDTSSNLSETQQTTAFTQANNTSSTAFTQASNTSSTAFTEANNPLATPKTTAFTQASDRPSYGRSKPDRASKPTRKKGQGLSQ